MCAKKSSDQKENWDKIFKGLVKLLRTKQDRIETLVKERKFLENRVKMQQDRWLADVRFYEDQLSQVKIELETLEMLRSLEAAKRDMLVGLKDRDAALFRFKLEHVKGELDDFKAWFHLLTEIPNDIPPEGSKNTCGRIAKGDGSNIKAIDRKTLETEIRKLRLEYENLASEKNAEVSALLRENGFAWDQFKRMESELADKLQSKGDEVEQANKRISSLLFREEELQSSNQEKDETIVQLKAKLSEMEAKKNEEISRLSQELESLRKSRSVRVTPVLTRCRTGEKGNTGRSDAVVKEESSGAITQDEKGSRSLKRKRLKSNLASETPKLFTSGFKIPKLKTTSPHVIQLS